MFIIIGWKLIYHKLNIVPQSFWCHYIVSIFGFFHMFFGWNQFSKFQTKEMCSGRWPESCQHLQNLIIFPFPVIIWVSCNVYLPVVLIGWLLKRLGEFYGNSSHPGYGFIRWTGPSPVELRQLLWFWRKSLMLVWKLGSTQRLLPW